MLSGTARYSCDGEHFTAGPGDFVMLPVGLPHTFAVDEPGELEKEPTTKWPSIACRPSADGGVLAFTQPTWRDGMTIGWIDLKTGAVTIAKANKRSE